MPRGRARHQVSRAADDLPALVVVPGLVIRPCVASTRLCGGTAHLINPVSRRSERTAKLALRPTKKARCVRDRILRAPAREDFRSCPGLCYGATSALTDTL